MNTYLNRKSEIINYIGSITGNDYIFGNIAFNDNDQVNVGDSLEVGATISRSVEDRLNGENKIFSQYLKEKECYSITAFLGNKKLKSFQINFCETNSKLECKILLYDFSSIEPIVELYFEVENNSIDTSNINLIIKPYLDTDEILPFVKTMNVYLSFYKIVGRSSGYIYLIRPINIELDFDGLTYMFLSKALSYTDIEIISHKMALFYLQKLKDKVKKESIKSAISAIMARNMSHNLGSHFISNTKHYFSNLADNDQDEQRQKDYRGIRHTLQYIQERMDFIATIVSTDRFPYGSVNVKSQIFDELTPDEFGERHDKATTNFLLDYIVFSENISKQSNISKSGIQLFLKLISDDGKEFGGQESENQEAKEEFAKLNLAVPGGILGRHAIFTIIENIIRNSAKHDKDSIPQNGLNISVKIGDDHIIIFDNKKNANKSINGVAIREELLKRYQEIKILSDGAIDKSNKGLKEILISALWLNNISLADWFSEYESTVSNGKINKLSEALQIVTVDNEGQITKGGQNLGYKIWLDKYEPFHYIKDEELENGKILYSSISAIKADIIVANQDYEVVIDPTECTKGSADTDKVMTLSTLFPRFYHHEGDSDALPSDETMMKAIIARNTGMDDNVLYNIDIHIEPKDYNLLSDTSKAEHCIWHATGAATGVKQNDILFKNHLSTLTSEEAYRILETYKDAAYIDSISGGDFTGTITQPFFLSNGLNRLKVIESALTEFVVIDERVFKNYGHGFKPQRKVSVTESSDSPLNLNADDIFKEIQELLASGKSTQDISAAINSKYEVILNVRILHSKDTERIRDDIDEKIKSKRKHITNNQVVDGNLNHLSHSRVQHKMIEKRGLYIYDINENGDIINLKGDVVANVVAEDVVVNILKDPNDKKRFCPPMFLSIHLSIIEKITKENTGVTASIVMENLKKVFGGAKFVTIHSGRGNLSAELETELKDYAFLSLSAIQATMDDSKYFLSQLLYNNCYIGKGRLNHK